MSLNLLAQQPQIKVKKPVYFRVSPPLGELIKKEQTNLKVSKAPREVKNEFIIKPKNNGKPGPDPLSHRNKNSQAGENLIEIVNFDGVDNIDNVYPPDPQGDVSPDYYMQCVNDHTAIYDKNGNIIKGPFPTSDFWIGSGFDDRNDGDAVILWDEQAQRWLVTQIYIPTTGNQSNYLLLAVSQTADPTGSYYQYAYAFNDVPDYPKWSVWPDAYYVGFNGFDKQDNYTGAYVAAFERDKMLVGDPTPSAHAYGPDSNLWSVFPADADVFPPLGTDAPFITDQVDYTTGNNKVYIYNFHVDWTDVNNSSFTATPDITVADYSLFSSDAGQVPQKNETQKLDLLHYRIMYRPYYRHFTDHESLLMSRTVNDNGIAAIRWYEFRNTGSGWSVYQQGTYNPGDGLWRWMPSIAMNANGDIALGYSVSSNNKYPSIRVVARYANDPLGYMTTSELEYLTGTASQSGTSRWGDYSMMSIDATDNTSFWYTNEYTTGSINWKTRILHFELPTPCTSPDVQASNFTSILIEDNSAEISWVRGNGDGVLVIAHEGAPVDALPLNGASYNSSNVFGNGDQIGNANYVVYEGASDNVTITGLNSGTTYYFSIYEYYNTDKCYNINGLTGTVTTTGVAPCTYCYAYGNTTYQTSITRVAINTIDNTSAKPTDANGNAYSDYTNISTEVGRNYSYDLNLQVNTNGDYSVNAMAWIDWNQNCSFDDAGENYDLGSVTNTANGLLSDIISVPSDALLGNTRMRVAVKYNSSPTSCETNFDGEVEDYTLRVIRCSGITTTWDGTTWDNGVPDNTIHAVIAGNYDTSIGNSFDCCSLTLQNGVILDIKEGDYVSVVNDFVNDGQIIVRNNAAFVQTNNTATLSGNGIYKLYRTTPAYKDYDYMFFASPIDNETIGSVFSANPSNYIYEFEPANFLDLYSGKYPQTTGTSDTYDDNGDDWIHVPSTRVMQPGRGYIAMGKDSAFPFDINNIQVHSGQTVVFDQGQFNFGPIYVPVYQDKYHADGLTGADSFHTNANLIGNPYPSAIDLVKLRLDNLSLLQGTFYFWTHDTQIMPNIGPNAYDYSVDNYATIAVDSNGIVSKTASATGIDASQYVASGQSFMTDVTGDGTLLFNNDMRVNDNNNYFLKPNIQRDGLWLNLTNADNNLFRQIYVGFHKMASDDLQLGQDAPRLENGNHTDFYSLLPNEGIASRHLAIQNLPAFNKNKIIPLGIKIIKPDTYQIAIDKRQGVFSADQQVFLQDIYTGVEHNLTNKPYIFKVKQAGIYNNRFLLKFISISEVNNLSKLFMIYPNPAKEEVHIITPYLQMPEVTILDTSSKVIFKSKSKLIDVSSLENGLYFVQIKSNNIIAIKKLIIKKLL